jgi:hypothetical protein
VRIVGVDPGPERSAWVEYDCGEVLAHEYLVNDSLRYRLRETPFASVKLRVEMIASYGMPVGREVFETCVWIGRFIEAWSGDWGFVFRKDVKLFLCGSARAKDANVRQALIDRFGGKEKAIGKKKTPGPLYGLKGDEWSALAVAVTVEGRIDAK